ncbi:MAG: hypothetical protein H6819_11485 [Phycisphaerales bacterium]|nr:hypothetical protein [Phycisphaerales bacterium]MCB9856808.1 hypothetical protein [Phycisphaerales bacterium]MCB9862065.1 hypothetical protein [Phycisphaerales bacterium]
MNATRLTAIAILFAASGCSQKRATFETDAAGATAFPTSGPLADAYDAYAQNRYRNVITECDSAIIRNPNDAEAHLLRGVSYVVCDEIYNGIEDFAEAFRLNPAYQDHDRRQDRAHDLYMDAVVRLDTTSMLKPRYADAFNLRATERMRIDDFENAIQCTSEAILLIPNHAKSYMTRADALFAQGKTDAAVADLRRAAELKPAYVPVIVDTCQRRATVERTAGRDNAARQCLELVEQLRSR